MSFRENKATFVGKSEEGEAFTLDWQNKQILHLPGSNKAEVHYTALSPFLPTPIIS